ncbi:MAG: bifunctional phosphoribosylaminoimidazolecarboxamide formyltransferase/IMP cyclohydrolase [candidate division WOR-3 bacterium]|nr:bifunctional phosphoribosylaminoimidazolecarboxamide formyltransferase/IMP cyclohydrolase [candidate division WOR-3 bacterium]
MKIRNALISMYDKEGLDPLLEALNRHNVNIYASSGTAEFINNAGYNAMSTESITGISQILGGRVKTISTELFAGILAKESDSTEGIPVVFDLLVVDLYPFEETLKNTDNHSEIIEKIDIGGISLIRAGAKNYSRVAVLSSKSQYSNVIEEMDFLHGEVSIKTSKILAREAFALSSEYDSTISSYLSGAKGRNPSEPQSGEIIRMEKIRDLRYGENPHQNASLFRISDADVSISDFNILHGKAMSYNNYMDGDAAMNMAAGFREPACAIVKHANPCGIGTYETIAEAYELAHMSDPMSAYGSIVALNRPCDRQTAELVNQNFVEIIIAPSFEDGAVGILKSKKNIRILEGAYSNAPENNYRYIRGSMLIQERDNQPDNEFRFDTVSKRQPTEKEFEAMKFAWQAVRYVKSNGIVIANSHRTMGIGAGQMSRVDAVDIAIKKGGGSTAYTGGAALASDGFFPFADSIEKAYNAGIYAVIEPGGSRRDMEIIKACDERDMALVFTGRRHFLH